MIIILIGKMEIQLVLELWKMKQIQILLVIILQIKEDIKKELCIINVEVVLTHLRMKIQIILILIEMIIVEKNYFIKKIQNKR